MRNPVLLCLFVTAATRAPSVFASVQERFMLQPGVTMVGFTYGLTSHISVSDGSLLSFNQAITTVGSKGQLTSGQFICYTDGIYKFQVYALTRNDTEVWLELYKNNDIVVSIYAHALGDYADTGNAAILELSVGDTVYVKSRDQYNVSLFGTQDEIYTTFTAVYLGNSFQTPVGLTPAFSVAVDQNMAVTSGNTIIYNKVITDIANIYDNRTGVVTIKSPGIYVIHFFSVSRYGEEIYQELYQNSNFVCALYNYADNEWSNAGNTAILHLKTGDTVSISAASDNNIYGGSDEVYSTFSGALIGTESDLNKQGSSVYAFTAGLSRDQAVTGGQKVIFDQIILNLHQVYNQATGAFSAPVAGVYEFMFHALGQVDEPIWLELYKNYKYINSLYSHNPGYYASGGNAAVLQLDAGDVVYVVATAGNDNLLYGRGDEIYCTFSGYLIRRQIAGTTVG